MQAPVAWRAILHSTFHVTELWWGEMDMQVDYGMQVYSNPKGEGESYVLTCLGFLSGLLQVWRGTLARLRYKRTRAALKIIKCYRRYKVKSYICEVARRFHNVKSMKDYGKHVRWPTPPKVLRRFEEALQAIYSR